VNLGILIHFCLQKEKWQTKAADAVHVPVEARPFIGLSVLSCVSAEMVCPSRVWQPLMSSGIVYLQTCCYRQPKPAPVQVGRGVGQCTATAQG
jgi:hypothetical protein